MDNGAEEEKYSNFSVISSDNDVSLDFHEEGFEYKVKRNFRKGMWELGLKLAIPFDRKHSRSQMPSPAA